MNARNDNLTPGNFGVPNKAGTTNMAHVIPPYQSGMPSNVDAYTQLFGKQSTPYVPQSPDITKYQPFSQEHGPVRMMDKLSKPGGFDTQAIARDISYGVNQPPEMYIRGTNDRSGPPMTPDEVRYRLAAQAQALKPTLTTVPVAGPPQLPTGPKGPGLPGFKKPGEDEILE